MWPDTLLLVPHSHFWLVVSCPSYQTINWTRGNCDNPTSFRHIFSFVPSFLYSFFFVFFWHIISTPGAEWDHVCVIRDWRQMGRWISRRLLLFLFEDKSITLFLYPTLSFSNLNTYLPDLHILCQHTGNQHSYLSCIWLQIPWTSWKIKLTAEL